MNGKWFFEVMVEMRYVYENIVYFIVCFGGWYFEVFSNEENLIYKEGFKNRFIRVL